MNDIEMTQIEKAIDSTVHGSFVMYDTEDIDADIELFLHFNMLRGGNCFFSLCRKLVSCWWKSLLPGM